MIYIFCNQQYGFQFMQIAIAYSKKHNASLSIVISDIQPTPNNLLKSKLSSAYHSIQRYYKEKKLKSLYGISFIVTDNVNSKKFRKRITSDCHGIITGFNQIFHKETIVKFKTFVNFHPSILPLYRGPIPSYWCIKNNERKTGFTLHEVVEAIDKGKILYQAEVEIERELGEVTLDQKIASVACPTFIKYLKHIEEGTLWNTKFVNTYDVYNNHVSYASFPEKKG